MKKKVPLWYFILASGLATALLLTALLLGTMVYRMKKLSSPLAETSLINAVGAHMVLPDESPTIATVTDSSKLQNQLFFHQALNGDKILLYAKAGLVVLYRPATHSIIATAPLTNQ
jgi:hypothetical protein